MSYIWPWCLVRTLNHDGALMGHALDITGKVAAAADAGAGRILNVRMYACATKLAISARVKLQACWLLLQRLPFAQPRHGI